jgi:predicted RNase H-like HicB family nuclease
VSIVHAPYTLERDEDGVWSAHAWLGSSGGANGNGATPGEAVGDLREAVEMVLEEDGVAGNSLIQVRTCPRER